MGFNFPASPALGATYAPGAGLPVYQWDGEKWRASTAVGGISTVYVSDTAPSTPVERSLWWESDTGLLYVRYNDGDSVQWVLVGNFPSMAGFVRHDAAQSLTTTQREQARQNIYAAPFDALAFSGMQLNGSFDVAQEATFTGVDAKYGCDGWKYFVTGTSVNTAGTTPAGSVFPNFVNCGFVNTTTAQASLSAAHFVVLIAMMEGYRVSRLMWGTSAAIPITIGFWSGHTKAGVYTIALRNATGTHSYTAAYTQVTGNVPQWNTMTIPGCPSGTWEKTNLIGIQISFAVGCGTTYVAPSNGSWVSGNYLAGPGQVNGVDTNGAVFRIAGVIIVPGLEVPNAERSPYIMRPYDTEVMLCKRYWQEIRGILMGGAQGAAGGGFYHSIQLYQMRAQPTCTIVSASYSNASGLVVNAADATNVKLAAVASAAGTYWAACNALQCDARL